MRIQKPINEIRTLLHDNLTDPNTDRRSDNKPWVFTHQPNTSTLPTIQIKNVDGDYSNLSIGNYHQFKDGRIQIDVRLRPNNEYDFDADHELQTASDGLDYLIDRITEVIINNQDTLQSNLGSKFKLAVPDLESDIRTPSSNQIEKSIDFIIVTEKTYT